MTLKNRQEAAEMLAEILKKYFIKNGIVLAIPRGGVPIGYVIAKELDLPLEVELSKKIGHPDNPEYAIGSVSLHGTFMNPEATDVPAEYFRSEADRISKTLKEKYKLYMGNKKPSSLSGKTVIIADDGIATGSTVIAAANEIRKSEPQKIIIATPVIPRNVVSKMLRVADDIVCLSMPEQFIGVGGFYEDFGQVSDKEVIQLLRDVQKCRTDR